jgi:hypothetical protein
MMIGPKNSADSRFCTVDVEKIKLRGREEKFKRPS